MCDSLVVLQNNVQVVNLLLTFDATNSCLRGIFHSPKKETEGIPHASPRAGDRAGHTLAAHPHIQLPPSRPRLRSIWKPMRHPRTRWRVCFLLIQAGRSGCGRPGLLRGLAGGNGCGGLRPRIRPRPARIQWLCVTSARLRGWARSGPEEAVSVGSWRWRRLRLRLAQVGGGGQWATAMAAAQLVRDSGVS
jgi:hypothetical protein